MTIPNQLEMSNLEASYSCAVWYLDVKDDLQLRLFHPGIIELIKIQMRWGNSYVHQWLCLNASTMLFYVTWHKSQARATL